MRIGIDIDGVITDIERFTLDYGSKYCIENGIDLNIKGIFYEEKESFGWTDVQREKFWKTYLVDYAKNYPCRSFAPEVINKLKEEGHEIFIITARNDEDGMPDEYYGQMQSIVKQWFLDNNINYDRIIFTEGSKLSYCVGNYIDVMIEDCPKNVKDISTKVKVLCMDCRYNKNVEGDNITRVYSWYDIYNRINKMK